MTNEFLKNELQEIMNGLKNLQSAFILLQEETEKVKILIKDQRYDLLTAHAVKTKELYGKGITYTNLLEQYYIEM